MKHIYTVFKCKGCNREFILVVEDMVKALKSGKYLSCPYCGCKRLKSRSIDDLRKI